MSNWGVKKLNDLPKVLWFLSCWVKIWTQTSLKRNTGKWKQFDLFCWQDYGYVLFALIFANGKIKPWSYFFFSFFLFSIYCNFQSVNQLYSEIISQGSLKIMWFIDRHHLFESLLQHLDDKLGNLVNLSEFQFSHLWNENNNTCIEGLFFFFEYSAWNEVSQQMLCPHPQPL